MSSHLIDATAGATWAFALPSKQLRISGNYWREAYLE
jgi:hypothetical protein